MRIVFAAAMFMIFFAVSNIVSASHLEPCEMVQFSPKIVWKDTHCGKFSHMPLAVLMAIRMNGQILGDGINEVRKETPDEACKILVNSLISDIPLSIYESNLLKHSITKKEHSDALMIPCKNSLAELRQDAVNTFKPTIVDDPTFGGTIYSLECKTHSRSDFFHDSKEKKFRMFSEQVERTADHSFVIDIENKTLTLLPSTVRLPNDPLKKPKTYPVTFTATRHYYEKQLKIYFNDGKKSVVIRITGSPSGEFVAKSAFTIPMVETENFHQFRAHYGNCVQK